MQIKEAPEGAEIIMDAVDDIPIKNLGDLLFHLQQMVVAYGRETPLQLVADGKGNGPNGTYTIRGEQIAIAFAEDGSSYAAIDVSKWFQPANKS